MTQICHIKDIICFKKKEIWVILTVVNPSLAALLSSTLFVAESRWSCRVCKTNVPQGSSDNLIYIIARKHLRQISAPVHTCHSYE